MQGAEGRRRIIEAATTPLVRAAAALHPGGASAADVSGSGREEELHTARLLSFMLQHLMTSLNGSYTDEGPQVWVEGIGSRVMVYEHACIYPELIEISISISTSTVGNRLDL